MHFIVHGSIAAALPPVAGASPSRAGTGSLGLITSDCVRSLRWNRSLLFTDNCQLTSPLSCRWRSDWLPCHPSQSIGCVHDRRFQLFTCATEQRPRSRLAAGNFRNGALRCGGDRRCPFVKCITVAPVQCGGISSRTAKTDYRTCPQRSYLSHLCFLCL